MSSNLHLLDQIVMLINDIDIFKMLKINVDDGSSTLPINFNNFDIFVTTPSKMLNGKTLANQCLNPEVVVFDEFDICFTNPGVKYSSTMLFEQLADEANLKERQFLFAGATLPSKIKGMPPKQYLSKFVKNLKVIQSENLHKFGEGVEFKWIFTDQDHDPRIVDLVKESIRSKEKCIIFCNNKKRVNELHELLKESKVKSKIGIFTSELDSHERTKLLHSLFTSEIKVMICTDSASRGIDTVDVKHVIMYDFPEDSNYTINSPESKKNKLPISTNFVHRVGRTGRLGSEGKVTSFIREKDNHLFEVIKHELESKSIQ